MDFIDKPCIPDDDGIKRGEWIMACCYQDASGPHSPTCWLMNWRPPVSEWRPQHCTEEIGLVPRQSEPAEQTKDAEPSGRA